jgi:hypothetical protein
MPTGIVAQISGTTLWGWLSRTHCGPGVIAPGFSHAIQGLPEAGRVLDLDQPRFTRRDLRLLLFKLRSHEAVHTERYDIEVTVLAHPGT